MCWDQGGAPAPEVQTMEKSTSFNFGYNLPRVWGFKIYNFPEFLRQRNTLKFFKNGIRFLFLHHFYSINQLQPLHNGTVWKGTGHGK